MSSPMRFVFMGTPGFVVPVLDALLEAGYDAAGVYTQPDRQTGRGKRITQTPVKTAALDRGLNVYQPASLRRDADARRQLTSLAPDLIVVAAYGLFLPSEVFNFPRFETLNIHPSLLPRHRGPSPVSTAVLSGDAITGVTIMKISNEMDAGEIVAQTETPILPDDTTEPLTARLFELGAGLLIETIPKWTSGQIEPRVQDDTRATITKRLSKEDGEIDWGQSAKFISRQIRAFDPWPGTYTRWQGKMLKIVEGGVVSDGNREAVPGSVIGLPNGGVGVATGDGVLEVLRLQIEGRRAVGAKEFVQGYRDFVGATLGK